ncbi:MAG TPA: extracellular solute-binding protein [Candidatus Mediterraneibacter cottocaccae]|nr:extracellular solute-binding protein [Candidatus Mediterraneibacter cottocaccae]
MKKKLKQTTSALLVAAMTAAAVAGCASDTKDSSDDSANQQSTKVDLESVSELTFDASKFTTAADNGIDLPDLGGEPLKLKVNAAMYQMSPDGTQMQQFWEEAMEHYLGCDIEIEWSWTNSTDYANNELVILQSGQLPDVASVTKGTAVNEYGEAGLLLNLADYEDYMKYYPEYMQDTNGGEKFAKLEDGSMYYFMDGFYNPDDIEGAQSFTSFAYRFDILQDLGIDPPTTLDEFTELCATLKEKIDSGEVDADYVIMNSTKDYGLQRGFVGIFHAWDCLYYNDGTWRYGPIEDNYREVLKYLNGLYEDGYIDPEFATADTNAGNTKATTGVAVICPTLWSGSASNWNDAVMEEGMQWGLAFLPENEDYGTPWKWGSRQGGKSLQSTMGIYVSAETEHPEYVVAMIDYQYSDEMVNLMNWGIEGQTYTVSEDGTKTYSDEIVNAEDPAIAVANYGLTSSGVCRGGIVFNPFDFNAMLDVSSKPEPWWNPEEGYYEGKYWVETAKIGGEESVAPYDRPPVIYLSADESSLQAELAYGGVCDLRARELSTQFITGQMDIDDDAAWNSYIEDIKSQTDEDFDEIIDMLNENTVTE